VFSTFLWGRNPNVRQKGTAYLAQHKQFTFSLLTRFEVARGLTYAGQIAKFNQFEAECRNHEVLPVDEAVIGVACGLWSDLRKSGQLIPDVDILIAATALFHGLPLVTRNVRHFNRVPGLTIENWFQP
jgi:tRNA(fMet)-specific endonuclease VapC